MFAFATMVGDGNVNSISSFCLSNFLSLKTIESGDSLKTFFGYVCANESVRAVVPDRCGPTVKIICRNRAIAVLYHSDMSSPGRQRSNIGFVVSSILDVVFLCQEETQSLISGAVEGGAKVLFLRRPDALYEDDAVLLSITDAEGEDSFAVRTNELFSIPEVLEGCTWISTFNRFSVSLGSDLQKRGSGLHPVCFGFGTQSEIPERFPSGLINFSSELRSVSRDAIERAGLLIDFEGMAAKVGLANFRNSQFHFFGSGSDPRLLLERFLGDRSELSQGFFINESNQKIDVSNLQALLRLGMRQLPLEDFWNYVLAYQIEEGGQTPIHLHGATDAKGDVRYPPIEKWCEVVSILNDPEFSLPRASVNDWRNTDGQKVFQVLDFRDSSPGELGGTSNDFQPEVGSGADAALGRSRHDLSSRHLPHPLYVVPGSPNLKTGLFKSMEATIPELRRHLRVEVTSADELLQIMRSEVSADGGVVLLNGYAAVLSLGKDGLIRLRRLVREGRMGVIFYPHETEWVLSEIERRDKELLDLATDVVRRGFVAAVSPLQARDLARWGLIANSVWGEAIAEIKHPETATWTSDGPSLNSGLVVEESSNLAVFNVGTIQRRKGVDEFSKLSQLAREKNRNWKFTWVGNRHSGDQSRLDPFVNHYQYVDPLSMGKLIESQDVLVSSSLDDPMPLCVGEALISGKHAVVGPRNGWADFASEIPNLHRVADLEPETLLKVLDQIETKIQSLEDEQQTINWVRANCSPSFMSERVISAIFSVSLGMSQAQVAFLSSAKTSKEKLDKPPSHSKEIPLQRKIRSKLRAVFTQLKRR